MRQVFDVEISDIEKDPQKVAEVQFLVKRLFHEFSGANLLRRDALKDEILQDGIEALPGLINATFVFVRELKDRQNREVMVDLMSQLANGNEAAQSAIFRLGFLKNPFSDSRSVARDTLIHLNWQPKQDETSAIRTRINQTPRDEDTKLLIDLYAILLRARNDADYLKAKELCLTWTEEGKIKVATPLLIQLLENRSDKQIDVLVDIIRATEKAGLRKDKKTANVFISELRDHLIVLLENRTISQISFKVLQSDKAFKTIEFLWEGAIAKYNRSNSADKLKLLIQELEPDIKSKGNHTLWRYWFNALSKSGQIEYIILQTRCTDNEEWAIRAAIDLFFKRANPKAVQARNDLEKINPYVFQRAFEIYTILIEQPPHDNGGEPPPDEPPELT